MTVINVTDATLKGDVAGPTFTGKVDGSKFSGSVTYTETGTTPPPEQTTGPTGGLITAFNPNRYETSTIDGIDYTSQTYGGNWSLKKLDDYTVRFEIRQGDHPNWSTEAEISELECGTHPDNNTPIKIAYRIMVEPGAASGTTNWCVCGFEYQHLSSTASAPITLELAQTKWRVTYRWTPPGGNPNNVADSDMKQVMWHSPFEVVRGQWYVFEVEAKTNQSSGYLRVKIDGQLVVNYTGPLGYGEAGKFMYGMYRETRPETLAANIKNMTVSWAKS